MDESKPMTDDEVMAALPNKWMALVAGPGRPPVDIDKKDWMRIAWTALRDLAAALEPMACGHPGACVVTGDEGTSHCMACEREGNLKNRVGELEVALGQADQVIKGLVPRVEPNQEDIQWADGVSEKL